MHELKVLFATDFEGDVRGGLQLATGLAKERAATLVVMHVVPIETSGGEGILYHAVDLASDRTRRSLERLVPSDPGVPFTHALEVGNPEERIASLIERECVDLLVLETRPRSAWKRVLQRNLVERLSARVSCPVVTYRPGSIAPERGSHVSSAVEERSICPEALTTILNARVEAIVTWMHLQREAVLRIAQQPSIRQAVEALSRVASNRSPDVFSANTRRLFSLELAEHQRALGALGVEVICRGQPILQMGMGAAQTRARSEFIEQLQRQGAAVSIPLDPADPAHASCVNLAGARLLGSAAEDACIVFVLDARRDFLRILAQPGPVPSAETYAFDADGCMLSNSRFPDQLRRNGLLSGAPGVQTARRLRICDPGCNILAGGKVLDEARPLTRMAAAAIAGEDGFDWSGYRDYRGVEVVGAWRWLAEHRFGVAAEMDREPV
jgi:nucleotide-binding universal stress UspA family protein